MGESTGVGKRIRERRIELGYTQEHLAKKMGYKSKVTICKVEGGKDNITSDRLERFAKALNCTPAYLMGWEKTDARIGNFEAALKDFGLSDIDAKFIIDMCKDDMQLDRIKKIYDMLNA